MESSALTIELARLKLVVNAAHFSLATLDALADGFAAFEDESTAHESILQSACTNLMQLNSCIHKAKQIGVDTINHPDEVTKNQFLQYLMFNELKRSDHELNIESIAATIGDMHYEPGQIGNAYVSHVVDELRGICFLIDASFIPQLKVLLNKNLTPMERLPEPREMFAYLYQGSLVLRCVRLDDFGTDSADSYQAHLIDIGCTINIEKSKRNNFILDDEVKNVPAFARKCHIFSMPNDLNVFELLHARIKYRIICIDGELVFMDVLSKDSTDFYHTEVTEEQNFYSYLWADSSKLSKQNALEANQLTNPIELSNESPVLCPPKNDNETEADVECVNQATDDDSTDEIPILPRSHLVKALYGISEVPPLPKFAGQSEKVEATNVICKETVITPPIPKFNGKSYKEITLEMLRNERNKILSAIQILNVPAVGDTVLVQPSHVLSISDFFAYDMNISNTKQMGELAARLNSIEFQKRPFTGEVKVGTKVLAMYKDEVFRAIIIRIYDKATCQIFYFDYGNCAKVHIPDLFDYSPKFDRYSPKVLHFRMNRIQAICQNDIRGYRAAHQILMATTVRATIVKIIKDDLVGTILVADIHDENGLNLAHTLANKRLAIFN